MAKPITITGKTELLAAIYDENNLPSAIIVPTDDRAAPFCLHSLREGDESMFEEVLKRALNNEGIDFKPEHYEEATFTMWRFFEDFPRQDYKCTGCAINGNKGKGAGTHFISASADVSVKLCEDCA